MTIIKLYISLNTSHFIGFLEKVKQGKAQAAGSGFGGKGLDRLDKERDAKEKAERKAYGEGEEKPEEKVEEVAQVTAKCESKDDMTFGNFKVEIKRGPAPDSTKGQLGVAGAAAAARRLAQAKEEDEDTDEISRPTKKSRSSNEREEVVVKEESKPAKRTRRGDSVILSV